jgi:two-component sensor histidine kinase
MLAIFEHDEHCFARQSFMWTPIMFGTGSGTSIGRIARSRIEPRHSRLGLVVIAVTLLGASGLIFEALTPRALSVTLFYVAIVLVGFWLPQPQAPLALALLVTPLVISGYWVSFPGPTPAWEAWTNRGLSIGVVWLAAVFVWRFRLLEERIHLLMREARHRTKNILSLVQAIARQTARGDAQDFIDRFTDRIQALAANQDLLVRHEWQRIDVKDLVQVQLGPFADLIGTRITFDGPKVHLTAVAAQGIGLALHELATNASKYGALSTETGCVDVSWQLDDDTYVMEWIERNGPPVQPPETRGFGTTVTESMVRRTLSGEVKLDYAPSGLQWRLTCRAADALEGKRPPAASRPT